MSEYQLSYTASEINEKLGMISILRDDVNNLQNYVTPQMFGAVADGVNDDIAAIQEALSHPFVYFPKGDYRISTKMEIQSNTTIVFDGESTLTTTETLNGTQSWIMRFYNVENVKIYFNGAQVIGDTRLTSSTLNMYGARNIELYDLNLSISRSTKDCLYIGGFNQSQNDVPSQNILISGGKIYNAGRNCISVTNADGVIIEDLDLSLCDTYAPKSGVDVEANNYCTNRNVCVRNCYVHDNGGSGLCCAFGRDVTFENNIVENNAGNGIVVSSNFNLGEPTEGKQLFYIMQFEQSTGWITCANGVNIPIGTVVRFYTTSENALPAELFATPYFVVCQKDSTDSNKIRVGSGFRIGTYETFDSVPTIADGSQEYYLIAQTDDQTCNVKILNNTIKNNGAVYQVVASVTNNILIDGNKITVPEGSAGIQVNNARNTFVKNNEIVGQDGANYGLLIYGHDIHCQNNCIRDFFKSGIYSASGYGLTFNTNTIANCKNSIAVLSNNINPIINNMIGVVGNYRMSSGLDLSKSTGVTVRDSNLYNCGTNNTNSISIADDARVVNCVQYDGTFITKDPLISQMISDRFANIAVAEECEY